MARPKSKNVGLIGLGIIGTRVAATLRKSGLRVYVWNRTPRPEQNFLGSPTEVAELCDVVQIFVSDDEALLAIVTQLAPGLNAQHVVTAHSTVAPETIRAAADIVQRRGARFLDAPFTGSKVAAENGQLVYYIGGDEAALKQARPILEASSKEIIQIGEIGDATIMKVATNIVTAATAQIGAEALALVRKAGLSAELFSKAMKFNASNSATLEMKIPLMEAGNYETHFSVKHMLKDVRIAAKLSEIYFLKLPLNELSSDLLLEEMKNGHADADYSSLGQRYFPARESLAKGATAAAKPVVPPAPATPAPSASKVSEPRVSAPPASAAVLLEKSPELPVVVPSPTEKLRVAVLPGTPGPVEKPPIIPPAGKPASLPTPNEKPSAATVTNVQKASESAEKDADEEGNLSGGFRGWLSRRAKRTEPEKDTGAV